QSHESAGCAHGHERLHESGRLDGYDVTELSAPDFAERLPISLPDQSAMKINSPRTRNLGKVEAIDRNRLGRSAEPPLPKQRGQGGFALVVALIMVALAEVIAVGVFTSVSVERGTATSYNSRYQADLAVQNGLQAAAKTLAASPNGTSP